MERQKHLTEQLRRTSEGDALNQELDDLKQVHCHEMELHQKEIRQLARSA